LKERGEAAEEKLISEVVDPEIDSKLSEDEYKKSALKRNRKCHLYALTSSA
jgi:hypothetical protein